MAHKSSQFAHPGAHRFRHGLAGTRQLAVTGVLLFALVGSILVSSAPPASASSPEADLPVAAAYPVSSAVPLNSRSKVIGSDWKTSGDEVVTGVGDADGFSILHATSRDGFEWHPVTRLSAAGVDTDRWIGNFCSTGDGSRVAVVYGPRSLTNDAKSFDEGAWAAIVDIKTRKVTSLGRGYSLAYFNPGCGAGQEIALTRYDGEKTYLGMADSRTGKHLASTAVAGQITSAVPSSTGGFVGVDTQGIVGITGQGTVSRRAKVTGIAFGLTVDSAGGTAFLTQKGPADSAMRLSKTGTLSHLASGQVGSLSLNRDATGEVIVAGGKADDGLAASPKYSHIAKIPFGSRLSNRGKTIVEPATPRASVTAPSGAHADGTATINLRSVKTRATFRNEAALAPDNARDDFVASAGVTGQVSPGSRIGAKAFSSGSNPVESERSCSIGRNDIKMQALQPMPRQVEWAVNRAVRGELTEARPANWRNMGMAAYSPQGMFPKTALTGGGQIPDQVLLGVLMQESNLWQASRYTSPGETGNPLVGNFYGNDRNADVNSSAFWAVNFDNADCGYGVGQVTDGMRLSTKSPSDVPALPTSQQQAIAVDYAANIAKAQQILASKWNQLQAKGIKINNNDPSKIENWFGAVWIYNTGYAGPDAKGYEGLGWSNNPANRTFAPNRPAFLDGHPSDAANPQLWPYPEKVMGFAAFSQGLIEKQTVMGITEVGGFRTASWNGGDTNGPLNRTAVKPPLGTFCTLAINDCNTNLLDSCQRTDLHCWFKASATWKSDCATTCGVGFYRFTPAASYMTEASASVGKAPSFPPSCTRAGLPTAAKIIDDIPLVADGTTLSQKPVTPACGTAVASQGSFTFNFGRQDGGSYPSKIDLQQLGGGLNGHFFFTHTRQTTTGLPSAITGTWNLGESMAGKWGKVYVHTPDHGAWTQQAMYNIDLGDGTVVKRALPQRTYENKWRSIGTFQFKGTPKVALSNVTQDGADYLDDIAWDAVAFEPLASKPKDFVVSMGDSFSSGEGAPSASGYPYYPETDNNGSSDRYQNACHRSPEAWARKAKVGTSTVATGTRADQNDATLDFHQISCSGAVTDNIKPGGDARFHELSQIDQGYLDSNTTLVTMSIGGNDIGFKGVITQCLLTGATHAGECQRLPQGVNGETLADKTNRLADELRPKLVTLIGQIQAEAPNAKILIMGYPPIFQDGVTCVKINPNDQVWLDKMAINLNANIGAAVASANSASHPVYFGDPTAAFKGRNICSSSPAVNGIINWTSENHGYPWSGDAPLVSIPQTGSDAAFGVSQQSFHPNTAGTTLYSQVMESTLKGK